MHRPPGGKVTNCVNVLEDIMMNLSDKLNIEINLMGDLNIDVRKPRNPQVRKYNDFLKRMCLTNMIKESTCFITNSWEPSTVDHCCTSDINLYSHHGTIHTDAEGKLKHKLLDHDWQNILVDKNKIPARINSCMTSVP